MMINKIPQQLVSIDSSNLGIHYIDYSKLDDLHLVNTVIEKIIDEAYHSCIDRIINPIDYMQYILHGINDYINALKYRGKIYNVSKIIHILKYDEYSFNIKIEFTYYVSPNSKRIIYKREIGSTTDDIVDRAKRNVNIKLTELFKKYDGL